MIIGNFCNLVFGFFVIYCKIRSNFCLLRLPPAELSQLCEILCLRAITNTRSRKIEKIMKYLSAPSQPLKRRGKKCIYT